MAAVSPAPDQTTELLQKLSLDSQSKPQDTTEVTKKPSAMQYGSINGGGPNVQIKDERSVSPLLRSIIDPNMGYISNGYQAFYYGGYNGSINEGDEYSRFLNHDGVEMAPGVYGDIYHHGYGYAPYGPYPSPGSPVPTLGHDGHLYGTQHYEYSGPFYQHQTLPTASYAPNQPPTSQGQISAYVAANQPPLSVDATKASPNTIANGGANRNIAPPSLNASQQNSSLVSNHSHGRGVLSSARSSSGYQDSRFGFDAVQSPFTWFDGPSGGQNRPLTTSSLSSTASHNSFTSMRNQNNRPAQYVGFYTPRSSSAIGSATPSFVNRGYPNNQTYSQYGSTFRTGYNFGSNEFNSRTNGHWGPMAEGKYKPTARANGFYSYYGDENLYGHSELNCGPRAGQFKNPKGFGPVTIAVKGQNLASVGKEDSSAVVPDKEQYNRDDFPDDYSDAKFFIIKSYSEDDIHKSVKYNVWASTPNGNKKLDAAYQGSQGKTGGCPVFLFFSVNTSGQFVGVAEMVGPVDFDKTVDYWQQDKWTGCFPVKWHIVKDVPNNILKHITLENNDNKPVTNSRDTQEVKVEQGLQMVKIFKEHASKTSILDDFAFYENRQKIMLEKKAKQRQPPKQVLNGKITESKKAKEDALNEKPSESVSSVNKESSPADAGEQKLLEENGVVNEAAGDALKPANGIANGC